MNGTALLAAVGWYLAAMCCAMAVVYRRRWKREQRRRLLGPTSLLGALAEGVADDLAAVAIAQGREDEK